MAYGTVKVDNITFDNGGSDQNVTVSGLYRATTSGVTLSGTIAATTVSGVTVIGSTTVSGATVTGTTANFTSGNFSNIISSAATMSGALIMANQQQVRFREAVGNGVNHIALQAPAIVSADQTITLPDQTGTVITTGDNGSVSSTMLATNLTISAAAGSASTPSIAFTGDLNTGIYSPGADQLAISTGGTGRLFIDSSGNVGIGTSGPTAIFHAVAASSSGTTNADGIRINAAGNVAINMGANSSTGYGWIQSANWGSGYVATAINPNGGNVGIGTSSPTTQAHIYGGGGELLRIESNYASDGYILFKNTSGLMSAGMGGAADNIYQITDRTNLHVAYQYRGGASGYQLFATNNTERLRIDSSGNVGIGTSSPSQLLTLNGNLFVGSSFNGQAIGDASAERIRIGYKDGAPDTGLVPAQIITDASILSIAARDTAASAIRFHTGTGVAERLRIDSSGNVGIGTSSPSSLLHLADAGDISVGTTTGTKIGTATTQKIGFYNATPVVQPTAVANATDAATVITQLNALLTRMRNLGLIAT